MLPAGVDWSTVSSLATGAGTLVLAVATFGAVRSSNRSARVAEAALQQQRLPLLAQSRLEDPEQGIVFVEGRWVTAQGGRAAVEHHDGVVYLAISVRNVGAGIAVCQGWQVADEDLGAAEGPRQAFRPQTRDLYIPPGDIGMWQGALRDRRDPTQEAIAVAIDEGRILTVELLYSDLVGRQRTISRFRLVKGESSWMANLIRHWHLDWEGPRSRQVLVVEDPATSGRAGVKKRQWWLAHVPRRRADRSFGSRS